VLGGCVLKKEVTTHAACMHAFFGEKRIGKESISTPF